MDINSISHTIRSYTKNGHELGQAISEEDADALVQQLIQRLGVTNRELDQSVRSLDRLETLLINYLNELGRNTSDLDSEESLRFLREVAAYIGKTFVAHSTGQWKTENTLMRTYVVFYYSTTGELLPPYRHLYRPLWNMALFCLIKASKGEHAHYDRTLRTEQRRKPRQKAS